MKKCIIAVSLMTATSAVFAAGDHTCQTPGSCVTGSPTNNSSSADANARANAEAVAIGIGSATAIQGQGQGQKQGQSQSSVTKVNVGGQSTELSVGGQNTAQSINISNPPAPNNIKVKNVPDAPDMIAAPTAPCRIAVGVSGSWIGGSVGIGSSVLDEGCEAREDVRLLYNMGLRTEAIARLCMKPEMATALGEKNCPKPSEQTAYAPVSGNAQTVQVDGSLESIHKGYAQ